MSAILVAGLLFSIEATQYFGSHAASFVYSIVRIVFVVTLLAGLCRLIISELIPAGEPRQVAFQRRMAWLVCVLILLATTRVLLGGGVDSPVRDAITDFSRWAFGTPDALSVRSLAGLAMSVACVVYGILIIRRRQRIPQSPQRIRPSLSIIAGLLLGNWIVLAPRLESKGMIPPTVASRMGERSPAMEAADDLGMIVQMYESALTGKWAAAPQYMGGWNLLTASTLVRINRVAIWLVTACGLIWAAIVWYRFRRPSAPVRSDQNSTQPDAFRSWLSGVVVSCFWSAVAAAAFYAWSALALLYCTSRVIAGG